MQWLTFDRLRWEKGDPRSVRYHCEACDAGIEEHHKTGMLAGGEWRATATAEDPHTAGFHISALYSPLGWLSWEQIARDWESAQGKGPTPVDALVDGRKLRRGLKLWTVSVSTWKADLYRRLWLGRAANFAVAFCEGPVAGIRRIWADGKLIYDPDASPPQTLAEGLRIYQGTETQLPDALITAHVGAAESPAYRGICYLVFENLQLADFANRIPQITAEILPGGQSVATAVHRLAKRAGVPTADAASATKPLVGYAVARTTSARAAIEELMMAYSLVGAGMPGGVTIRPRGVGNLSGMDEAAFGAREEGDADGDHWRMSRAEENALPRELTLTHMDPARDYQPGTVRSTRQDGSGLARAAYDIAVVLDADEAKARAEQAHRDLWAGRNTVEGLTLSPGFATLQPGDSLDVLLGGQARRLNLTRVTVAPNGLVEVAAAVEQGVTWLPRTTTADPGTLPAQQVPAIVPTVMHLLDLPMLRAEDDDAGFYVAAGGDTGWRSAAVLRAVEGLGYEEIAYIDAPAVIGTCQTVLPAGPWAYFDDASTLDVLLVDPQHELEAVSEAAVLAGANAAVVGDEIVQFRDAILVAPGNLPAVGLPAGKAGDGRLD